VRCRNFPSSSKAHKNEKKVIPVLAHTQAWYPKGLVVIIRGEREKAMNVPQCCRKEGGSEGRREGERGEKKVMPVLAHTQAWYPKELVVIIRGERKKAMNVPQCCRKEGGREGGRG